MFYKTRGTPLIAGRLLASQDRLCPMELVMTCYLKQKLCKHVLTVNCKNKIYVQSFQMSLPLQFKLQYSAYTFNTPFSPQNTGEANATNRRAETFTGVDSVTVRQNWSGMYRQEMLSHRMTMLLRREIAQHFDNLQRTNISTEMTACEGT